jgi:pilus assembly protein CpaF
MRPDRIVVGECRGAEVRELLQALNTGHEGGCGTLHANTAADVPARLEALGMIGGLDPAALAAQAASALDVVLHLGREDGVRRLQEIALLRRGADGRLGTVPALDLRAGARRCLEGWPELAARLDRATQARTPHTRADLGAARAER